MSEFDEKMSSGETTRQTRAEIAIGELKVKVAQLSLDIRDGERTADEQATERRAWQDMVNVVLSQIRLDIQRTTDTLTNQIDREKQQEADTRKTLDDHETRIGAVERAVLGKVWLSDGWKIVVGLSGWAVALTTVAHFLKWIP